MFADPLDHLSAELQRLDLLLHREILRLRAAYQLSLDEFRGLYVSDEQVDRLVNDALSGVQPGTDETSGQPPLIQSLTERAEALRASHAARTGPELPWSHLIRQCGLSPVEQDILLLALAPEIDLKYETLFAYLNNDVTRKWPTCDLALRVVAPSRVERARRQQCLHPQAPLFRTGLLRPIAPAPERPSWLAGGFSVAPAVLHFVLGQDHCDPRFASFLRLREANEQWDEVPLAAEEREPLRRLVSVFQSAPTLGATPVVVYEGRRGAGRSRAAGAVGRELGLRLLHVDAAALRASMELTESILQELLLLHRLHGAGVYLARGEALFEREGLPTPEARRFVLALARETRPFFFACALGTEWRELLEGHPALPFEFADPGYIQRRSLWEGSLARAGIQIPAPDIDTLADRFILNPGQIRSAVASVVLAPEARDPSEGAPRLGSLLEAARAQSARSLGALAARVSARHDWEDLVLPRATLQRVREIAAAIRSRHVVYSDWGFGARLATGSGLKILFAGASGTGKTMTAGVIARDLGLDLYRIDLSSVVSKYIGETEKNLEAVFRSAQCSNAILFFDEADALFGKRSEVKDAHDRYANIEIAYLLQRMEGYDGIVILASNLSKNMDEAFSRRMQYVVEFPMPDEEHREKLWHGMFGPEVPLDKDVDCRFLAAQFPIAGGDIRNVALDAAFLAAQDGRVITMKQLVRAMARQMMKQGRIPSAADFKQYHALIAE